MCCSPPNTWLGSFDRLQTHTHTHHKQASWPTALHPSLSSVVICFSCASRALRGMTNISADWANVSTWAIFPLLFLKPDNCRKRLIPTRLQLQIALATIKDADQQPNNLSYSNYIYEVENKLAHFFFRYFEQSFPNIRETPAGRKLSRLSQSMRRPRFWDACPSPPDMFHCSGSLCVSEQLQWWRDVNLFVLTLMEEDLFSPPSWWENQRVCGPICDTSAPSSGRTRHCSLSTPPTRKKTENFNQTLKRLSPGTSHILRLFRHIQDSAMSGGH